MNYFVLATHAVTVDGEWVIPESVQQVDFDSLLCIYCKLQIGVQFDPLTSTRTFVHIPRHINNVARLKTRQKLSRLQKCAFDLLGVGLDIENYCTLRVFFGLTTLAGLSRRNVRCGL